MFSSYETSNDGEPEKTLLIEIPLFLGFEDPSETDLASDMSPSAVVLAMAEAIVDEGGEGARTS